MNLKKIPIQKCNFKENSTSNKMNKSRKIRKIAYCTNDLTSNYACQLN